MAVGVVVGYLLGRRHKKRLAALLALLAAAGGKVPIDEREVLRRTPVGAPLDKLTADIRTQLVDAGTSVVKKAAISEKLQSMRGPGVTKGGQREEEPPRQERTRQQAANDHDDYGGDIGQYESAEPESERDFR
ncbi:hypothetical protein [Actinoallomurus sp. NPDC050550]|uniref:hypothetical protein n=1 Tax=Actinoallomurus sp. NPDC050550 TaxID=3154937 RepID=UPI003404E5F8